jgi:hypothetical protein
MPPKEQFEAASAYIKAKQYDKVRKILKRIAHLKVDEWLAKLDQMPDVKVLRRRQTVMIGIIVIALVVSVSAGSYFATTMNAPL